MRSLALLSLIGVSAVAAAQFGSAGVENPFSAPAAKIQYAPDRTYHLKHLRLDFDVDYPNRLLTATSTNTIVALRDGATQLRFHAGGSTKIESVELDGQLAHFTRDSEGILVDTAPTTAGKESVVKVKYHLKKSETPGGNGVGGWHWHEVTKSEPSKMGFYTNGETKDTRDWAVTWDYPNDFTTTETHTTVPIEWQVIGNGLPISDKPTEDGKRHTVVWKLDRPHATYLTSLVAGPFDIHRDKWRGMPLYYVAPKGMGGKLDYSFEHTKDILSFYSDNLGVRFPWPKYAQDITYDFGGGQENVSATTYGTFLTDPREGDHTMDSLISHETGHQWFGDYVTCKDWGQLWLNESFATLMEMTYTEHSLGRIESLREIEQNSQDYFAESKRYKRPLATNFYSDPGVMFDSHTYPKGGALLMSLKRLLGDKPFYAGLHRYLTLHHNSPVETNDLCSALTEATGINLHPWFDQWILKPGHPVIEWSWNWDGAKKEVVVHVNQTQDLKIGTPIYDVPTHVGLLWTSDSGLQESPIHLNAASQEFRIAAPRKPEAVVFDPEHEFVREIPKQPWTEAEYPAILKSDPNPVDRAVAFDKLIEKKPSHDEITFILEVLRRDRSAVPAILNTRKLIEVQDPGLKAFWQEELKTKNMRRKANAVEALGKLASDPAVKAQLKAMVNDKEGYDVVGNALEALSAVDFAGTKPLFLALATKPSYWILKQQALSALAKADAPEAADLIFSTALHGEDNQIRMVGYHAMLDLRHDDPRLKDALKAALQTDSFEIVGAAENVIVTKKLRQFIPELRAVTTRLPFMGNQIERAIKKLSAPEKASDK